MARKFTTSDFKSLKKHNEKITMLTAYDYSMARILDLAGTEAILVGDSLGMVMYGNSSTLHVTMEDMIRHTKAVANACSHAMVIADMPFMSFALPEDAVRNAGRLIKEGNAEAVKLEGGRERVKGIKLMIEAGIPVMGHIGLTPQYFHQLGGYKLQGKTALAAERLLEDALILQNAGIFALVLEMVPQQIAKEISSVLDIPTIGIGAGVGCDGQILVGQDMLGFSDRKPYTFVKKYVNAFEIFTQGIRNYVSDVKNESFPAKTNAFNIPAEEFALFKEKMRNNNLLDELVHKTTQTDEKSELLERIYGN